MRETTNTNNGVNKEENISLKYAFLRTIFRNRSRYNKLNALHEVESLILVLGTELPYSRKVIPPMIKHNNNSKPLEYCYFTTQVVSIEREWELFIQWNDYQFVYCVYMFNAVDTVLGWL